MLGLNMEIEGVECAFVKVDEAQFFLLLFTSVFYIPLLFIANECEF